MSSPQAWPAYPYLDALSPDRGWSVELALFATYSADVPAIAAALLALTGRHNDDGGGAVSDFVEGIEALRGRMRIVLQRGRLARPERLPKIAGVFDQFLIEAPFDEAWRSWHPKVALIRYAGPKGAQRWRLWLGSRNLTCSRDLDTGLLLDGTAARPRAGSQRLEGVPDLGRRLAAQANLPGVDPEALAAELARVSWTSPPDIAVRSVELFAGAGAETYGPPPGSIDEIVVVSPFLCPVFLKRVGGWGQDATERTLLSIPSSLRDMAARPERPLAGFHRILAFGAPEEAMLLEAAEAARAQAAAGEADEAEPPALSLHAKLVAFRQPGGAVLRVGSANATHRAWSQANVEVVAELLAGPTAAAGLDDLCGRAQPIALASLEAEAAEAEHDPAERLEESRKRLAAGWTPRLERRDVAFTLAADAPPPLASPEHRLSVGLATAETLVPWPSGALQVELGDIPLALHTEIIQMRVEGPEGACGWMQKVAVTPPLDAERDNAAIGRHLGPHAFIDWVRSLLSGEAAKPSDEGWDRDPVDGETGRGGGLGQDTVSLEEILSAWARDKDGRAFKRTDDRFERYLTAVLRHAEALTPADRKQLADLRMIWRLACERLVGPR